MITLEIYHWTEWVYSEADQSDSCRESWLTFRLILWTPYISINKQIWRAKDHPDENREWKIECCLGHLLDLRCCDLVKIQLNPGASFPINPRSLSRRCLSDLYLLLRPTGNGDDFHNNGLDSVLFLVCRSSSSAKQCCNSIVSTLNTGLKLDKLYFF